MGTGAKSSARRARAAESCGDVSPTVEDHVPRESRFVGAREEESQRAVKLHRSFVAEALNPAPIMRW